MGKGNAYGSLSKKQKGGKKMGGGMKGKVNSV